MVHRIQNRNPGYSDFSGMNMSESFAFQSTTNTPVSDGATALKLEDEVQLDDTLGLNETQNSEIISESINHPMTDETKQKEATISGDHSTGDTNETEPSNGLENFGLQEEGSFELFDDNNETENALAQDQKDTEEDELEIPAFLRRQKN